MKKDLTTIDSLSKLFDAQMETLKARGYSQIIIDVFISKRSEVLLKASKIEVTDGHILFIPVIPRTEVDFDNLMKTVRNHGREGYNHLSQSAVSNVVDVPKGLYFMFDVEDGKDMLGKSPEKAQALIKEQKRSCLTVEEVIALCVHKNVLSEHNVDCTGSRCKRNDRVPNVYLNDDEPKLGSSGIGNSNDKWGSASCRERS